MYQSYLFFLELLKIEREAERQIIWPLSCRFQFVFRRQESLSAFKIMFKTFLFNKAKGFSWIK